MAYSQLKLARDLLSILAIAPIVFAATFLLNDNVAKLLVDASKSDGAAAAVREKVDVPVVLIVLDELSLSSLLDLQGNIDAARYPAFSDLASTSTWFRNASTVSPYTNAAVPAILTGKYPTTDPPLPILYDHPENVFTMLHRVMALNIHESDTALYSDSNKNQLPAIARAQSLVNDLGLVYLHMVVPDRYTAELPSVSTAWGNFSNGEAEQSPEEADRKRMIGELFGRASLRLPDRDHLRREPERIRDFIDSIVRVSAEANSQERSSAVFHFLHSSLPHQPFTYTAAGLRYSPTKLYGTTAGMGWEKEPRWTVDAYQRRLMRLEYLDQLLAELLSELRRQDLFDATLLIVTADHGISFWPGSAQRSVEHHEHPEDILSVPLFIKRPGQSVGIVDNRHIELIDIVPTIVDVLGVEAPWYMDGCSVYQDSCPKRSELTIFDAPHSFVRELKELRIAPENFKSSQTLRRKHNLFGTGRERRSLAQSSPYGTLAQQNLDELVMDQAVRGSLRVKHGVSLGENSMFADSVRFVGVLELEKPMDESFHVALVIDSVVSEIVPAVAISESSYSVIAMLPEDSVTDQIGEFEAYILSGTIQDLQVQPLEVSTQRIGDDSDAGN